MKSEVHGRICEERRDVVMWEIDIQAIDNELDRLSRIIEKRETEIEQLKKQQKKTKKKIAILSFITGALTWHIVQLSINTFLHRSGTLGGEVLIVPLLGLMFYMGWCMRDATKLKGELEDD